MSATETAERQLLGDLASLGERFADEEFSTELYRALAGGHLTKDGAAVAPSWSRAEEMVNRLRGERGQEPLTLAQTGGEGEASDLVRGELERLGWRWRPRDTGTRDPDHAGKPAGSPPPQDAGERQAPISDPHEWERRAHEEAEHARLGHDAPAQSGPGEGAGGGTAPRVGGS
ncbi:MAG TPA: hypothetical protein VN213_07325 [Solirubrobacteraceae bacterium]|nr:hypothetical protein [Solirubrobacteraceae bacterium]